jgi:hypothetical protein
MLGTILYCDSSSPNNETKSLNSMHLQHDQVKGVTNNSLVQICKKNPSYAFWLEAQEL